MILICGVNGDDNERDIKTSLNSSNRFIFHLARVLWLWPPLFLSSPSRSSTHRFPDFTSKGAAKKSSAAVEIKTVDSYLKFMCNYVFIV